MELPTIEELREKIKRLDRERKDIDMERGYCIIPQPSYKPVVSDVWAFEAYNKHKTEIYEFLAEYAALLLEVKKIVTVGELPKLIEWRELLEVGSECKDTGIRLDCFVVSRMFLKAAMEGDTDMHYAKLADWIASHIGRYPSGLYYKEINDDGYGDGEQGTFEEYYARKQEELRPWQEN